MEAWRKELYHSELYHFGVKHRSGRYPYGSGDRPYQDREGRSLDKWRNKEVAFIEKRTKRLTKTFDKQSKAALKRYNKLSKKGKDPTAIEKARDDYTDAVFKRSVAEKSGHAEAEYLKSLSIDKIKDEQLSTGYDIVRQSKTSISLQEAEEKIAIAKTKRRVGYDKSKEVYKDSLLEAMKAREASTKSGLFYGYKNYGDLYAAFVKTDVGKRLEKTGNQGAFENAMEAWAKNQQKRRR